MTKPSVIALAGQPNCGKSTIFNMLTGARQHVANYPGVTVEKKYGTCTIKEASVTLVDLPGTYSLTSYSPEELAARQFILNEHPDVLLAVADASTLEKSLYLTVQLLEMERNLVLGLNMIDVAQKRHIYVDENALSTILGVPVVPVQASANKGKDTLMDTLAENAPRRSTEPVVDYGLLEAAIARLQECLTAAPYKGTYPFRWLAIKLLEQDADAIAHVQQHFQNAQEILSEEGMLREAFVEETTLEPSRHIAACRHKRAREIAGQCCQKNSTAGTMTEKIDALVCHRVLGPIILFGILFIFYHASVTYGNHLAAQIWPFWAGVESFASNILPAENFLHDPLVTSLGVWVVKSMTAVLNYLPIFFIMFSLVALLEDSGYMARIAFVLDRLFRTFGLHGQSTLPLILGGIYVGGCAIPGVIATRAIPDDRARFATIMIIPMMNCLAKVPLYLLLIGVFFAAEAGMAMFFMGTITLIMGLIAAKVLTLTVLRGKPSAPFIIELPIYHVPSIRSIFQQALLRIWMFIKKICTVVLAVSIVIFMLISFPNLSQDRQAYYAGLEEEAVSAFMQKVATTEFKDRFTTNDIMPLLLFQDSLREQKRGVTQEQADNINAEALQSQPVYASIVLRQGKDGKMLATALRTLDSTRKNLRREFRQERFEGSLLGIAGKALEPITAGAGFNWRINVALLSALAAKENSAATLGAIYGVEGSSVGKGFESIESGFTPLHALALMLFMALYPPCLPAAMMVKTQTASTGWMLFSIGFQMSLGLIVATTVFSGAKLLGLNGVQAMWVFYGFCASIALILAFIPSPPPGGAGDKA